MYDALNSPSVHFPKNLGEYTQTLVSHPSCKIWGGGTAIMREPKSYPSRTTNLEIVSLDGIEDLKKSSRNDRMVEFGSVVNLEEIITNTGKVLPRVMSDTIKSIGSQLLTREITLGGSIATISPLSTLPATLIVLDSSAEIRYIKKKSSRTRWITISQLFNDAKGEKALLPQGALITKVRININQSDFSIFIPSGDYLKESDNYVSLSFSTLISQQQLASPRLALTFPNKGIISSKDLDSLFLQLQFPLYGKNYSQFISIAETFINSSFSGLTKIQKTRVHCLLESLLDSLNEHLLTEPLYKEGN